MEYNRQIHNIPHLFKAIIGTVFSFEIFEPKSQLIVLNYHGTQVKFIQNFIEQINYLKKHYEIISPSQFENLVKLKKEIKGKKLVLTFDDGVKNNKYAIEELDKLGISAYFFAVPQYIDTPIADQKKFFLKNIRPITHHEIDNEIEDFLSLSWDDLIEISKKHTIGCHTYSHTMLKNTLDREELENEIIESKLIIESHIGKNVTSFCSINNTLLTIGKKEDELLRQNYWYHFTTFGGNNLRIDPFLIKRINVESHWLKGALKFALSPFEFYRWSKKVSFFKDTIK
jgi:peptidoglycan/xylan/chitin deacetylase (PgdA/CDA1 family)